MSDADQPSRSSSAAAIRAADAAFTGMTVPIPYNPFYYTDGSPILVSLLNADVYGSGIGFGGALQTIATQVAQLPNQYDSDTTDPTQGAVYFTGPFASYISIEGFGFTYDTSGVLDGGYITSIDIDIFGPEDDPASGESITNYTNLFLYEQEIPYFVSQGNPVADFLQEGGAYIVDSSTVHGYDGADLFIIEGTGTYDPQFPPANAGTTTIYGEGGVNVAEFPYALRADSNVIAGGGNETVVQSGITADLLSIGTLQFIDGSMYEDNSAIGAQAALMFEGIMGHMPDAINAGGFALLAQQYGTAYAGDAMLMTPEGQAATAGLTDGQYVAQLYTNIEGGGSTVQQDYWVNQLAMGNTTRGGVAAALAASPQAQTYKYVAFSSNSVFAADPGAVDVLRAYEALLGRLPEVSALGPNSEWLDEGAPLSTLYAQILGSAEFSAKYASNPYGLTPGSSFSQVYSVTHSDAVTNLISPLITAGGGVGHQAG